MAVFVLHDHCLHILTLGKVVFLIDAHFRVPVIMITSSALLLPHEPQTCSATGFRFTQCINDYLLGSRCLFCGPFLLLWWIRLKGTIPGVSKPQLFGG